MEADETRELIEQAVETAEEGSSAERRFRDRVAILVGVFAVVLAVLHMASAAASRDTVIGNIQASDTYAYMQAKIIRETVLRTAGKVAEADRLRAPDAKGHGIGQLQAKADALAAEARDVAARQEGYERGETALQVAIVLLSIALVARSRWLVAMAVVLAVLGIGSGVVAYLGAA